MGFSKPKQELLEQLHRVPMDTALWGAVTAGVKCMDDKEASRRAGQLAGALDEVPSLNARARELLTAIQDQGREASDGNETSDQKKKVMEAASSVR